ncbi:Uma2 family endonuclease [Moorena sp. SIOASIH]|uniref:Uma2 family endonuclease n=1 Tax=Moorena sp. SIOASIH TaxID=2607817 RepID=UPI00344CE731
MTSLPYPSQPLISPRQTLPTMYDLPSENPNEPGLPDEFHFLMQSLMGETPKTALHRFFQPLLLFLTFAPANSNPELVFSACDLNLYYDLNHPGWYKRPDWFGVVGVPRLYQGQDLRLSYVIWQEQVSPFLMQSLMGETPKTALHRFVVVELLSPGTEDEDHGQTVSAPGKPPTKWQVYEQILRVPYYVIFSRFLMQSLMGETTAVAHGGNPQDRAASPRPRCIATPMSYKGFIWLVITTNPQC